MHLNPFKSGAQVFLKIHSDLDAEQQLNRKSRRARVCDITSTLRLLPLVMSARTGGGTGASGIAS